MLQQLLSNHVFQYGLKRAVISDFPSIKARKPHIWIKLLIYVARVDKTYYLIQKQPSCKKMCGPQEFCCEKRCEIQSGGQEMAVMVGY